MNTRDHANDGVWQNYIQMYEHIVLVAACVSHTIVVSLSAGAGLQGSVFGVVSADFGAVSIVGLGTFKDIAMAVHEVGKDCP